MNTDKEIKLKKVLAYQFGRKLITKKEYQKELDYIKKLKEKK